MPNKRPSRKKNEKFLFIGGGKMAEAIMSGIISSNFADKRDIFVSEPNGERQKYISKTIGVQVTGDNRKFLKDCGVIILAVKPNIVGSVLNDINTLVTKNHLIVSVAAGIPIRFMESHIPNECRVIRIMPNTPCLVNETAAGISLGRNANKKDEKLVVEMLSAVGKCFVVEEKLLDAVTGLSGSGPAFICMVIQALADGAVKMGLPRDIANTLAAQTTLGTAKMVLESDMHVMQLRDSVITPGGTTIEGIHELEHGALSSVLMNAVEAAALKSKEMGKMFSDDNS